MYHESRTEWMSPLADAVREALRDGADPEAVLTLAVAVVADHFKRHIAAVEQARIRDAAESWRAPPTPRNTPSSLPGEGR